MAAAGVWRGGDTVRTWHLVGCWGWDRSLTRLGHGEMQMHITLLLASSLLSATLSPPSLSPLAPSRGLWAVDPSQSPSTHTSRAPKVRKDPGNHQVQPLHFTDGETEAKRELAQLSAGEWLKQGQTRWGQLPVPPASARAIQDPHRAAPNPQWMLATTPRFSSHFPHHRVGWKCSPQMLASPSCEIFVFFIANERVSSTTSISSRGKVCFLTGVAHPGEAGAPFFNQPPL